MRVVVVMLAALEVAVRAQGKCRNHYMGPCDHGRSPPLGWHNHHHRRRRRHRHHRRHLRHRQHHRRRGTPTRRATAGSRWGTARMRTSAAPPSTPSAAATRTAPPARPTPATRPAPASSSRFCRGLPGARLRPSPGAVVALRRHHRGVPRGHADAVANAAARKGQRATAANNGHALYL
eukprot:COSAG04_NODE_4329_length_2153_cov_2.256086_3_plen_178_part_00